MNRHQQSMILMSIVGLLVLFPVILALIDMGRYFTATTITVVNQFDQPIESAMLSATGTKQTFLLKLGTLRPQEAKTVDLPNDWGAVELTLVVPPTSTGEDVQTTAPPNPDPRYVESGGQYRLIYKIGKDQTVTIEDDQPFLLRLLP